jgi:hypothetical protein
MKELESSHTTPPESLRVDICSLTEKIGGYSDEIELLDKEIEQLHSTFAPTEGRIQSFVCAVRQLLNYLPIGVPELFRVREEIERLPLLSNAQQWPFSMQDSYRDLQVLKIRLDEALQSTGGAEEYQKLEAPVTSTLVTPVSPRDIEYGPRSVHSTSAAVKLKNKYPP